MVTRSALRTYLQSDPDKLGIGASLASGALGEIEQKINAVSDSIRVSRGQVTMNEFVVTFLDAFEGLDASATPQPVKDAFAPHIARLHLLTAVDYRLPKVKEILMGLVQAKLLPSEDDLTRRITRPGSSVESAFGAGVFVTHTEIAAALQEEV